MKKLTSGQLIDALKSGKTLRYDPYQKEEPKYCLLIPEFYDGRFSVNLHGWGSAVGNVNDRLMMIIEVPDRFEIQPTQ